MGLFNNNNKNLSPLDLAKNNFNAARMDILLVAVLTIVNIVIVLTGSDSYFLFSASVPFYLALYGMLLTGRFPPEFYTGEFAGMTFIDDAYFYVMLGFAVVIIAFYLLCFFMLLKKPNKVWFIAATIAFAVDTVAMFLFSGIGMEMIIDIVIHVLVLVYFIKGIKACVDIKKLTANILPETSDTFEMTDVQVSETPVEQASQTPAEDPFVSNNDSDANGEN